MIYDSLAVCHFLDYTPDQMVELLKGITGWETGIRHHYNTFGQGVSG